MNTSFLDQIVQSISFPFKDPQWGNKILIGLLIGFSAMLIPILPVFILAGYGYQIMKRIIHENGEPYLPEWSDWGRFLVDGCKLTVASWIYALPIILLILFGVMGMVIPGIAIGLSSSRAYGTDSLPPDLSLLFILYPLAFAMFCAAWPLGILVSLLEAPAISNLVDKDRFSAAFHFSQWWPILKAGLGPFVVAVLGVMLLSFIGSAIAQMLYFTVVLCFLYPAVLGGFTFLFSLYNYSFVAMAYREGKRRLAGPA